MFAHDIVWGVSLSEYVRSGNDRAIVIAQIETLEVVENVEEIARVPGIGTSTHRLRSRDPLLMW